MAADLRIGGRNYYYTAGAKSAERYPSLEQPGLYVSRRESLREFGTPLQPAGSRWIEFSERTQAGNPRHVYQRGAEREYNAEKGRWEFTATEWGRLSVGMLRDEMRKVLPTIPEGRNGTALIAFYIREAGWESDPTKEGWRVAHGGFTYFPDWIRDSYRYRSIVDLANAWLESAYDVVDVGAMAIQVAPAIEERRAA